MTIPRLSDRLLRDELAAQQIAEEVWLSLTRESQRSEALVPLMQRAGPVTRAILVGAGHPEPSPEVWRIVVRKIERRQRRALEPAKASP